MAEVLITLGVIGVVAAITIPGLMTHLRNKKLESQFKKTYAELNIAARAFYAGEDSSVHDYDSLTVVEGTNQAYSNNVLDKFMSYYKSYQTAPQNIWYNFDHVHNITQNNLNGNPITSYPCDRSHVAIDMVGRLYSTDDTSAFSAYGGVTYGPKICVDTNGIDPPNRLGYDRFVFVFTENNSVVPYTGNSWSNLAAQTNDKTQIAQYCSYSQSTPAHTCAYFALENKSPTGNGDYWRDFLK